jgi:hypothetical protein
MVAWATNFKQRGHAQCAHGVRGESCHTFDFPEFVAENSR